MTRCAGSPCQPRRRSSEGTALVEFALVFPIFALMLFAMIQFGLVFAGWSQLRNQVESYARLLAMNDPCAPSEPTTAGCQTWLAGQIGQTVGASGAPAISCGVSGSNLVLTATAPVEDFTTFPSLLGLQQYSATSAFYLQPLTAPTSLYAVSTGRHHVTLSWTAPPSNGCAPIQSYNVNAQAWFEGNAASKQITCNPAGSCAMQVTVTLPDLNCGTPYTITVEAVNVLGSSPKATTYTQTHDCPPHAHDTTSAH